MDFFGIGQAMKGMALIYIQASRRTGRTVSMVESLKDGDRVVFHKSEEADRVRRMCKERGVNVDCIVMSPDHPEVFFERGTSQGKTIFDHSWVEQYYLASIEHTQKAISHFERNLSGFGEAHYKTRRKAIELSKWQV